MVDIEALKAEMREKNVSVKQAADAIGINEVTFYRRINKNGERFTVSEVDKLANFLQMDGEKLRRIFFVPELAKPRVRRAP